MNKKYNLILIITNLFKISSNLNLKIKELTVLKMIFGFKKEKKSRYSINKKYKSM